MAERIYLDHAATTPVRPEAIAAVEQGMRCWANPSSPHAEGRAARAALEDARSRIKAAFGWAGELIFTSGASEAIGIALTRARCGSRLVGAAEHDSVLRAGGAAPRIPVLPGGSVDTDLLDALLDRNDAPLVAVQHVNSEIGKVQEIADLRRRVAARNGLLFCDASQSAGKYALPDADMIAVSAHKFGGPIGIGALLVRDFAMLEATGGQEFGYRGGTENLPGALGMAAALDAAERLPGGTAKWLADLQPALLDLRRKVADAGGETIAQSAHPAAITAIVMPGVKAAAQLIQFDSMGFAVSAGSACSSGSLKTSHVLEAIGTPRDTAERTIRVSIGWTSTADDIARFAIAWEQLASRARSRAA